MGTVSIEVLSSLAQKIDSRSESVTLEQEIGEGATVRDILNRLRTSHPRLADVIFDARSQKQTEKVNIFLNGRNLELENGLATVLGEGDTLTFVSPIIGG